MPSAAWPTASVSVLPSGGVAPVATVGVSQADGTFRALVPPATGYTIQVTATGYVTYDSALLTSPVSWNVTPLTATAVGTITLAP